MQYFKFYLFICQINVLIIVINLFILSFYLFTSVWIPNHSQCVSSFITVNACFCWSRSVQVQVQGWMAPLRACSADPCNGNWWLWCTASWWRRRAASGPCGRPVLWVNVPSLSSSSSTRTPSSSPQTCGPPSEPEAASFSALVRFVHHNVIAGRWNHMWVLIENWLSSKSHAGRSIEAGSSRSGRWFGPLTKGSGSVRGSETRTTFSSGLKNQHRTRGSAPLQGLLL